MNCTNEKRLPKEALSTDWRVEVLLEADCSPSYAADVCTADAEVTQFAVGHAAELGNGFAVLAPVAEFLCDAHCGDPLPCGRHIRPLHLLIVLNVLLHKKQRPLRMPPMRLAHCDKEVRGSGMFGDGDTAETNNAHRGRRSGGRHMNDRQMGEGVSPVCTGQRWEEECAPRMSCGKPAFKAVAFRRRLPRLAHCFVR